MNADDWVKIIEALGWVAVCLMLLRWLLKD